MSPLARGFCRSSSTAAAIARAAGPCSTAKATFGLATTSPLVGRGRIPYGRAMPLSSIRTAKRCHRSPPGFLAAGSRGACSAAGEAPKENAWFSTYGGKSIAVFDKSGKPLTPLEGITFNGRLGLMQGIIATPSGDVWALGVSKRQLINFPKGDWTKGRIVCEGDSAEPCKSFLGPFHLAVDQQDRIWVSNASDKVTRFVAADPSKTENFKTGYVNSGLNIDSQGNVWVTNRFGDGLLGMARLVDMAARMKLEGIESAT